jgi:hypothetical protein
MGLPGTSVLAAAATYAGIQVRGSLKELRARLLPWETSAALEQEIALDAAGMSLVPRILDEADRAAVAEETLVLAERVMRRFAEAPFVPDTVSADLRDDQLLEHEEAASLILGLQDRTTRDRAAEWMEGDEAGPALRLWRALARRCVGPYGEHAAAPLTLAGWVAWSAGDDLEAREALAMALGADPDYLFARLLHQACNEGLDPESVRRCLRAERRGRTGTKAEDSDSRETAGAAMPEEEPVGADTAVPRGATGTEGGCAQAEPGAVSRRRRRTRGDGPVPDGSRPVAARTDGTRPGPSRTSGRTRTRTSAQGGPRRRGTGRPGVDPGSDTPEEHA